MCFASPMAVADIVGGKGLGMRFRASPRAPTTGAGGMGPRTTFRSRPRWALPGMQTWRADEPADVGVEVRFAEFGVSGLR